MAIVREEVTIQPLRITDSIKQEPNLWDDATREAASGMIQLMVPLVNEDECSTKLSDISVRSLHSFDPKIFDEDTTSKATVKKSNDKSKLKKLPITRKRSNAASKIQKKKTTDKPVRKTRATKK